MSAIDREALLVALVLAPATYSRNRFFSLYTDPEIRRIRRRASLIRGIVQHVSRANPGTRAEVVRTEPSGAGRYDFTYVVPALGLRRTATLDPIELSLVRFAMSRSSACGAPLDPDDPDRRRIEAALHRLAPRSIPPSAPPV
jgi:hypothetical protein